MEKLNKIFTVFIQGIAEVNKKLWIHAAMVLLVLAIVTGFKIRTIDFFFLSLQVFCLIIASYYRGKADAMNEAIKIMDDAITQEVTKHVKTTLQSQNDNHIS